MVSGAVMRCLGLFSRTPRNDWERHNEGVARMNHARSSLRYAVLIPIMLLTTSSLLMAQNTAILSGQVSTGSGKPLVGVNVYISGTNIGSTTDETGHYQITRIPAGEHLVTAEYVGRESQSWRQTFVMGAKFTKDISMATKPLIMPGIVVTASPAGAQQPLTTLSPNVIRRSPARVSGELIRQVPGVDAVRRGPVGLDPVIRGLRETEVGAYIDGSRMFPAGPGRMDSPISHIDPNAIQKIQVVKGPYALTWGAGNLSAIRVETPGPADFSGKPFHATAATGFHSNINAADATASVLGASGKLSYWASGTWRQGQDYNSGADQEIPGDFKSREARGKIGLELTPRSNLTFSAGYQRQDDVDYPGRLLNADFFNSSNVSGRWQWRRTAGLLRSMDLTGYYNFVDHGMGNDEKPTALPGAFPNGNPRPAFDIHVDSEIRVAGGRFAADLETGGALQLEIGGDLYATNRDALRTIARRDNGMVMMRKPMWADVDISVFGLFLQAGRQFDNGVLLSATVRSDFVSANADTANPFYLSATDDGLDDSETNLSAALTVSKPLSRHWLLSIGAGSVVRTADANERFSDHIPSSKSQMAAEFVGNPTLNPERSTQADLWLEATYSKFSFNANLFARKMNDYITLESTGLSPELALSPPTVFGYINGDASFLGFEAAARYQATETLSLLTTVTYLRGEDDTLDEPALGIAPFGIEAGFRFDSKSGAFFLESAIHVVAEQTRVATTRGEIATDGYLTADISGGVRVLQNMELRAGIVNLLDESYINHLNSKNPFTGQPLPEPGRVLFTNLSYAF